MAQTLTAQRLAQLLSTDANFITNFIVGNNPAGVADKLATLGFTRPTGEKGIGEALQFLLQNGRGNEFVEALNVPLTLNELSAEQLTAVYSSAGSGVDANTVARALAQLALRLYEEAPVDAPPSDKRTDPPAAAPAAPTNTCSTCMDPEKKKKVMRYVLIGVGAVLLIVTVAWAIRVARKS